MSISKSRHTTVVEMTHHMSRPIHGSHRQRPRGLGLACLPATSSSLSQILRLPAPFHAFDPTLVGAEVIANHMFRGKSELGRPAGNDNIGEYDTQ